jgi:hypothetical protein
MKNHIKNYSVKHYSEKPSFYGTKPCPNSKQIKIKIKKMP